MIPKRSTANVHWLILLFPIFGFSATSQAGTEHPPSDQILIEAESFDTHGGWKLDTQFITSMGSPYLLAHGIGTPVDDATITVALPAAGTYHVFVRTKDWVAPWDAPASCG